MISTEKMQSMSTPETTDMRESNDFLVPSDSSTPMHNIIAIQSLGINTQYQYQLFEDTNKPTDIPTAVVTPYETVSNRIMPNQPLSNFLELPIIYPAPSPDSCNIITHYSNGSNNISYNSLSAEYSRNKDSLEHQSTTTSSDMAASHHAMLQLPRTIRLNKFVRRLHSMLIEEKDNGIVEWRKGLLVLHSTHTFAKTLLPKYFNTRNFKTFRRQLNYYGFVHIRSFSTTGSTTTALWVNQDLAKRGSASISSVLLLKRVDPCPEAKTAEGRRVRKEEAVNSVEDIDICAKSFQLSNTTAFEQMKSLSPRDAHQGFNIHGVQLPTTGLCQVNTSVPLTTISYETDNSMHNITTHAISATSSTQSLSESESSNSDDGESQSFSTQCSNSLAYAGIQSQPILPNPWVTMSPQSEVSQTSPSHNKTITLYHHDYRNTQRSEFSDDCSDRSTETTTPSKKSIVDQTSSDAANLLLMLSRCPVQC